LVVANAGNFNLDVGKQCIKANYHGSTNTLESTASESNRAQRPLDLPQQGALDGAASEKEPFGPMRSLLLISGRSPASRK